jgi:hypothetical protein
LELFFFHVFGFVGLVETNSVPSSWVIAHSDVPAHPALKKPWTTGSAPRRSAIVFQLVAEPAGVFE